MNAWIILLLVTAAIILVQVPTRIWLVYYKLDELEACFSRSPAVARYAGVRGGLSSRTLRLGLITPMVLLPNIYIKNKSISADDVACLPARLRYWVYYLTAMDCIMATLMFIVWVFE